MVKRLLKKYGLLPKSKAARLRREGNLCRDAHRWADSAAAYTAYLRLKPRDADLWIQLGHVQHQAGHQDDAVDAYRQAIRLDPQSRDAYDPLVRILVRAGKDVSAIELMLEALGRGVAVETGILATSFGRQTPRPAQTLPPGMVLYSIHDMIGYLHHHPTLSGIQRVQAGIAKYLIDEGPEQTGFVVSGGLGCVGPDQFALIDKAQLAAIIDYATGENVDHLALKKLLLQCSLSSQPVAVGQGHTMIVLGAFWALGSTPKTLWPAKRAGAKIGVYIYDLIPLTHPQFCVPELTRDFCRSLSQILEFADFFLTISDYTRITLQDLMVRNGLPTIPAATVPLAHTLTRGDTGQRWPQALANLDGLPFVAYVSTIEGRKNHLYVIRIWQMLIDEGVDVPDLVFVGRKGWRNDVLYDVLEQTDNLGGKVHIVHDLDDAELNGIYAKALFTVFTSFVEGWGLPVGESLIHGTPCVASNTSSIPEVGASFVDYVDPTDIKMGVQVIRKMITQPIYLKVRRDFIQQRFKQRSWSDVGRTFGDQVDIFSIAPAREPTPPLIPTGNFVLVNPPSHLNDPTWYFSDVSESLVRDNFYAVENFGAWMRGQTGVVCLRSNAQPETSVFVYLSICTSDPSSHESLTVTINGREVGHKSVATLPTRNDSIRDSFLRFEGHVDADGVIAVGLDLAGPIMEQSPFDPRQFLIGLRGVGVAELDGPSRSDLLESILLTVRKLNG